MSAAERARLPSVLRGNRIIPIHTPANVEQALGVAGALSRGGIGAIEVTLRTPVALDAISAIAREFPAIAVGAGTILEPGQFDDARRAGARFAVSPGSSPALLAAGREAGLLYLPGVATSSEVMAAMAAGYGLLKLFPAEPLNALALLAAWRGPFADVAFCPTGGIDAAQASRYLRMPNVACIGGSWLTPADALAAGDWSRVERIARDAAVAGSPSD